MARSSTGDRVLPTCGCIVIVVPLLLAYWFLLPWQSGRLDQMTLEDGTELRLIQKDKGWLYDVAFYLKRPGEKWGWCFVDKEERSWKGRGKLVWDHEQQTVGVFRGGDRLAEYSPRERTLTVFRMYQPVRPAPQKDREPPY